MTILSKPHLISRELCVCGCCIICQTLVAADWNHPLNDFLVSRAHIRKSGEGIRKNDKLIQKKGKRGREKMLLT